MSEHPQNINPPRWLQRLLRAVVKKEYLEEIEGDMEEVFYDNVERFSPARAKRMYAWEVIKLLRPNLIRNLSTHQVNQVPMFKNYAKVSLRGLLKSPINSFINIFGLSAAIGFAVFSYAFAQWVIQTDDFHEHKHEVFLTTFEANRNDEVQQLGTTPRPLGESQLHPPRLQAVA